MRQHHPTPLDLITVETGSGLAVGADDRQLAAARNREARMITGIEGFLKCNKPGARWIDTPNGEVPFCGCGKIIVDGRRSDGASSFLHFFAHDPITGSLELEILRRRFTAVAGNFELDLLAFIE